MKELRRKTFFTIFFILSAILLSVLILLNMRAYAQEREDIRRNLNILEDRGRMMKDRAPGVPEKPEGETGARMPGEPEEAQERRLKPRELENMMILDYELYTVALKGGQIDGVYDFGTVSEDFDVYAAAEEILQSGARESMAADDLYFRKYCYRYHYPESIVILNNAEIAAKLRRLLIQSVLLFAGMEVVLAFVARLITGWITRPAEEAFARQKEFIADASHELKTPLAVIMASADEMQSQEGGKYLENIRYEAERMNKLISGLLNLSRLENGEDRSLYKEEDLSRILEKSCLAFDGVAFEQGVDIQTDIEEHLLLKCNKEEIEQMTSTILDNAVHHSYRDTTVRVTAAHGGNKGSILIRIINTGDPIPAEEEEKIFERFYRGDRARSRKENRYGLGLAIARRIARNHNGDIRAHSEGGDTAFTIELKK